MKKTITLLLLLISLTIVGCNSKEEYSQIYMGDGENWEVEFRFPINTIESNSEEFQPYQYIVSYKHDVQDLSVFDEIRMGYLWIHQDAEINLDDSMGKPLITLLLSHEYEVVQQAVRYVGDGDKPTRLFVRAVGNKVVWNDPKDNEKFETGFIIRKEDVESKSDKILFAISMGDKNEIIDVIRED